MRTLTHNNNFNVAEANTNIYTAHQIHKILEHHLCKSSGSKRETTHRVTEPQEQEYRLDYIGILKGDTKHVWIKVELNGVPLKMELDLGASVSFVSKKTWQEKLGSPPLTKRKIVLRAYLGHKLHIIGETTVDVKADSQHKNLPLVVVEGEEAPLVG